MKARIRATATPRPQTKRPQNMPLDSAQIPQEMRARTGVVGWTSDDSGRQMLSFDIYLKGNVSRAVLFFKSAGKENQKIPDIPVCVEESESGRVWRSARRHVGAPRKDR